MNTGSAATRFAVEPGFAMTEDTRPLEQIAVGVDGSLNARAALRWAVNHARAGDTITVVHVWEPSPAMVEDGVVLPDDDGAAQSLVHHELAHVCSLADSVGVALRAQVLHGKAKEWLCHLDNDLMVVGACGHGGVAGRLLGSVSYYLARHARTALVIVPSGAHEPTARGRDS